MAKKAAKAKNQVPTGLLAKMTAEQAPVHHNVPWHHRLPPDQRKTIFEIREGYQSGLLRGWTARSIYERVKEEGIDVKVGLNTFRHWLGAHEDG